MMNPHLKIEHFTQSSEELEKNLFHGKTLTDLVGNQLTTLLEKLLDDLGVKSDPIVETLVPSQATVKGRVYISRGVKIEPTAYIAGPCYIGPNAQIRHGAYIRGSVFVGSEAVVGHATEVKGSIFCHHAKAGHFAYVGDSILGTNANLGAGTKLANLKFSGTEVKIRLADGSKISTGLRKLGAIIGANAQTGCNAVLSPGTVLYPKTAVGPCVHFHGTLAEGICRQ